MTRELHTLSPDATVGEAALLMRSSGHGALPVVDEDGKLLGLITKFRIAPASSSRSRTRWRRWHSSR